MSDEEIYSSGSDDEDYVPSGEKTLLAHCSFNHTSPAVSYFSADNVNILTLEDW
jgi:hypothetical protein